MQLTLENYIDVIGILASLIVSLTAIIISVITLKQNSKMIESSIRPYIVIYIESITICEQQSYFIIKNFGQSSGKIIKFTYPPILKNTDQHALIKEAFDSIEGITLAPSQICLIPYDVTSLNNEEISFIIQYKSETKNYKETFSFNPQKYIHIPRLRPETFTSDENKRIASSLREMIEKSL